LFGWFLGGRIHSNPSQAKGSTCAWYRPFCRPTCILTPYAAVKWASERARTNSGPTLIEFFTYRAEGHSTSDDPSGYRPANEAKSWPLGDPIERLKAHLIALGEWDEDRHVAMTAECDAQVRAAQKESEKLGILPEQGKDDIGSMFDDVYADVPWHLAEQRDQALSEGGD